MCSCITCALIPFESVEIALDALYTIDILKNEAKYLTWSSLSITTTAIETIPINTQRPLISKNAAIELTNDKVPDKQSVVSRKGGVGNVSSTRASTTKTKNNKAKKKDGSGKKTDRSKKSGGGKTDRSKKSGKAAKTKTDSAA